MKKLILLVVAALAVAPVTAQQSITPESRADKKGWMARFEQKKALAAQGGYNVVFIGDSITHHWENEKRGAGVWAAHFADGPYKALNCGISGDRTEHVLWRLDNGQLDGLSPKAIVLMIGTNNMGHRGRAKESPLDTILGIQDVIARLRAKCPEAKIILHPIFPRGATITDEKRMRNDQVNATISKFADGKDVLWCDFNSKLVTADGTLETALSPDLLHFMPPAYETWATALKPYLDYALGIRQKAPPKHYAPPMVTAVSKKKMLNTTYPIVARYWLTNTDPKVEPRLRNKRALLGPEMKHVYDAIWIGDSITHFWEKGGKRVFEETFGNTYKILNLGFGGDKTQNTLWNIECGGLLDNVDAKLVTLMIGTNNTWKDSAEDIATGIKACIAAIQAKLPQAKIMLFSVLPREVARKRGDRDFRRKASNVDEILPKIVRINELIRPFADGTNVIYVDLAKRFTTPDGLADIALLSDGTHPSEAGFRVWAEEVMPLYRPIIGK